jgi:HEAT repeat protein
VLIEGLNHPIPHIRHECAHVLDTYDDGRAAEWLAPLIDDPAPRVRWMAMHALVCDGCKAAPAPLGAEISMHIAEHTMTDSSVNVRRHAVFEIARCGPPFAIDTLRGLFDREADQTARRTAARMLKGLSAAD